MHDFSLPYKREEFCNFLKELLPEDLIIEEIEFKDDSKNELTKKIFKIGEVKSLNNLQIFEVEHSSINDPRVSLTKKVFSMFKKLSIEKAIIIFYTKNSQNYRFSLIESNYKWLSDTVVTREFSMPKRLSFFLGPESKVHTPSSQFKTKIKNYNDLKRRFDIEVISEEFFQKYKDLFLKITEYLNKDKKFKLFLDEKKIETDLFAKKFLGQIVFCYFLQKKGCLGAKKNQTLSNGDKFFLRNSFELFNKNKKNFYNEFFEFLIYDGLNKENKNNYIEILDCKVPYLNGGLFEEIENYDWKNEKLNIPNSFFSNNSGDGVLDIFDLYNFTVDENDGLDVEIGIDPEMLGKVFEKLLPENFRKGKGSYYTPRFVVSFMSKQIIKNFLISKSDLLNHENFIYDLVNFDFLDEDVLIKKIEQYQNNEILKTIDNLLTNIKICDPAIGSGAFPVLIMNEIVKIRFRINNFFEGKKTIYLLKREFIENSIYGVDIDKGAIEISKLRLWLSLIVEEKNVNNLSPLPNLSYKILQGNSLVQKYKDHDFDVDEYNELFTDIQTEEIKKELVQIQKKYFNLSSRKIKKDLRLKLEEKINSLILKKTSKSSDKSVFSNNIERNFFLWKIFFLDVFENNGFDLVIGNPPYIFARSSKLKKFEDIDKKYYIKKYKLAQYQLNTYALFIELGINLLKENGFLSFIIPNNWMTINTNEELRKLILKYSRIEIINFSKQVFKNAAVDACVVGFNKNEKDKDSKITIYSEQDEIIFKKSIAKTELLNDKSYNYIINFDIISDKKLKIISNKIIQNSKPLYPYYANIYSGLKSYEVGKGSPPQTKEVLKNRIFHNNEKINEHDFKYLDGSDVKRYAYSWSGQYLSYGKHLAAPRKFSIFNSERILVRQIPSKPPYSIVSSFFKNIYLNDINYMNVYDFKINPLLILGIINSKLITFWFIVRFAKLQRGLFPQFKLNELKNFPIPDLNDTKKQNELISEVKKIIKDPADKSINDKIDNLVYNLFFISSDEKMYIENYLNKFNKSTQ